MSVVTFGFAVVVVFMIVLVVLSLGRSERPTSTTREAAATTTALRSTSTFVGDPVGPQPLEPAEVSATSELSPEFGVANLIDGDPTTAWRFPSRGGERATLTFSFAEPVSVIAVIIAGLPNEEAFHNSDRIHQLKLTTGSEVVESEVPDSPEPFRLQVGGEETDEVTLDVISTYAGEPHGGEPARQELAVGEVEIIGRPAG